ncbi:unnamed protein product, partial [Polarella glacialis]
AAARAGRPAKALELLQVLRSNSALRLDAAPFNAALGACARGRCWNLAVARLGQMLQDGLTPNAITYTALLGSCRESNGRERQWRLAGELLGS